MSERVARGLAYNAAYQLVEVGLAFAAMLILVRVIPQAEYGRVSVVVGVLTLLNALGFAGFAAHALQVRDGEEPDWSLHWTAGLYIQGPLVLICHAIAGACWLAPAYRPVAPLLHLAAIGLALDWPAQLRAAMLRRAMDFRRLKIAFTCATLLRLGVTLGLGLAGAGAYALVLGGNVLTAVPLAVDLLLVSGWRPRAGWWRPPDWRGYAPSLRFGVQQAGSALVAGLRGALEAAVLPYAIGYGPIGLLDRARAMLGSTVGRAGGVLIETVYPLLPRSAGDAERFARQSALFVRALLLVAVPASVYVALEGSALSRLLYGWRWEAADPLIAPAAVAAIATSAYGAAAGVLLAASRLGACFALDVALTAALAAVLAIAALGGDVAAYAWAVAAVQVALAVAALAAAAPLLGAGGVRRALAPPIAASALAAAVLLALAHAGPALPGGARLALHTAAYWLAVAAALRALFPEPLAEVLRRVPAGARLGAWLGLPAASG